MIRALGNLLASIVLSGMPPAALADPALAAQTPSSAPRAEILVEAEGFAEPGGWALDTQSIDVLGSAYLLAHGLGKPVRDAETTIEVPEAGTYRVFVRTKDWVARWGAPGHPGRFRVLVDGNPLAETFGTRGAEWAWHDGGTVELPRGEVRLSLRDLTGFDGRCDAIYLTMDPDGIPPEDASVLPPWRRRLLDLPEKPEEKGPYDLVVIGGGYAGMGAAISAARMGCRVALIQNRPVLGGNGSSEVRVWAQGLTRRGRFPRVGEIVEEFADRATKSPGREEEFGDEKKVALVRAEKGIDLFLDHHAYAVEARNGRIDAVLAMGTRTSRELRFTGRCFADCTGHATIGHLAGADWEMTPEGRMGMSNMWAWAEADAPAEFPQAPWTLDLDMDDFPYPRDHHGQWFWESGFDKDPIRDAEGIRDWNLRAVYGAFNAMKNRGGAEKHRNAVLTWVAYIGGPRESRRLLGDVILSKEDIVEKRLYRDGCVPSTWSIDLHYPKKEYAGKFPEDPFISIAEFDARVDRSYGYPIPYRCFYSRNVKNLFMAGRCISVTHEALGTTRVMKTGGMMGEVVGKAAAICAIHGCDPRDVYESHLPELEASLRLPGKARRTGLRGDVTIPEDVPPAAGPFGPFTGLDPASLEGTVIDDRLAAREGAWTESENLKGYVGWSYAYASADSGATCRFDLRAPEDGPYEIRIAYRPHENRGDRVPVTIRTEGTGGTRLTGGTRETEGARDARGTGGTETTVRVDMRREPPRAGGFASLGEFGLAKGEVIAVIVGTEGAGGIVCVDAVQIVRAR